MHHRCQPVGVATLGELGVDFRRAAGPHDFDEIVAGKAKPVEKLGHFPFQMPQMRCAEILGFSDRDATNDQMAGRMTANE